MRRRKPNIDNPNAAVKLTTKGMIHNDIVISFKILLLGFGYALLVDK